MLTREAFICIPLVFSLGCAPAQTLPPRPPPERPPPRAACPLGVADARVTVENTADGVALLFTSQNHVEDLRERGRHAAKLHGPFGRAGKGHDGRHGGGGQHGLHGASLPQARATTDDIEGGVRITLVPSYPSDLDRLRAKVLARAQNMSAAPCDT